MAATTLDPAKKAAGATLSNGNLTVTTVPGAYSSVLSTNALPPGRGYFEVRVDSLGGVNAMTIGIGTAAATLTASDAGNDAFSIGWSNFSSVFRWNTTSTTPVLGSAIVGTIFAVAYDTLHNNFWVKGPNGLWNGRAGDNPATNAGGKQLDYSTFDGFYKVYEVPFFAEVSVYQGSQATTNFGATGFSGTVPSGFSSVDALVAAGIPAGVTTDPHRYWRLSITADGGANSGMAAIALATTSGGANVIGGGTTVGASSAFSGGTAPSMAIDGNAGTWWASNSTQPHWFWLDLGVSPAAIREVKITARNDGNQAFTVGTFAWQWSDDNTGWQAGTSFTPAAWTNGGTQTFLWGAAPPGGGTQARALVMA